MGYNATAKLVYGFRPTEAEEKILDDHKEIEYLYGADPGELGIFHSGDGRSEQYSPVFGILMGKAWDWEPNKIPFPTVGESERTDLKNWAKEFGIKYKTPCLYLVAYTC